VLFVCIKLGNTFLFISKDFAKKPDCLLSLLCVVCLMYVCYVCYVCCAW